jgi:aspartyl-tRNA(Asn)/glutamyl-tRNA(Gln) amidotransferase subunit C
MSEKPIMDIDYVSNLIRIELTSDEKEKFQGQLGDVLKYFERLQGLDVEGVEPTAHAFPRFNVWDEDESKEGLPSEKALMNAPKSRNDQVVVPKVVE